MVTDKGVVLKRSKGRVKEVRGGAPKAKTKNEPKCQDPLRKHPFLKSGDAVPCVPPLHPWLRTLF